MKKSYCYLLMVLVFPSLISGQTGKVFDNLSMKSQILKMDRKYSVYFPPDYETSNRSYPVLYL
ncbi:MAG TPA: esterase family protein, partial [Bacteroidales bacterium]|nr:esterase family protein [Bacteroidales bacterium]